MAVLHRFYCNKKNACMINNQLIGCLFTVYLFDLNGIKAIVIVDSLSLLQLVSMKRE